MTQGLLTTALHDWHALHKGRMVEFSGWKMPVQYANGIVAEHHAVRQAIGLFDISHMARIEFKGPAATDYLDQLLTKHVAKLKPGQIRYSLITDSQGGILDDVLVYRLPEETPRYYLVVNAGNAEKIRNHLPLVADRLPDDAEYQWVDDTLQTSMFALQGPKALELMTKLTSSEIEQLKYYRCQHTNLQGVEIFVSRTGYTGEDGFELVLANDQAEKVWNLLLSEGEPLGIQPAGLGARDTLRLEAAMPLYGHELSEEINPFQAGLGFAVDVDKGDFWGAEALKKLKGQPQTITRVGLELEGKRIAREHYPVLAEGQRIGEVTSGTFSPTLQKSIAMAYVGPKYAAAGTQLAVEIRGKAAPAEVVSLPFYQRKK